MDISDRETIEDFANSVRHKSYMEALYLFTYVDSRGTNDDAMERLESLADAATLSLNQRLVRRP